MKGTRIWLAVLLLLHLGAHPLVHAVPRPATVSDIAAVSIPVADTGGHEDDCQACRAANGLIPTACFALLQVGGCAPLAVSESISNPIRTLEIQLPARAPPAR